MRIAEAKKHCEESLERYQALQAAGKGKNIAHKIAVCEEHIALLSEMALGGKPWHNYTEMVNLWGCEDFVPRIIS